MAATYTFDVFCSLDGYGSYTEDGDWGGYWSKQGPQFLDRRRELFGAPVRLVFGANTYRQFVSFMSEAEAAADQPGAGDPDVDPNVLLRAMPATVVSSTLADAHEWPGGASVVSGDPIEIVTALKQDSDVPLRSHGSLSLNWTLMAAGLVDLVQVTIFPVITGSTGQEPIFGGAADFDLDLVQTRTFDARTIELTYRPTRHS